MPFSLSPQSLREAESSLAVSFPDSYKISMQQDNGGEIEFEGEIWFFHPIRDLSDRKRTSRTANHVELETMKAKEWDGFPSHAISIAGDDCGNRLVFLRTESNPVILEDAVFRWDHETCKLEVLAKTFEGLK
ncbi:MAG: SMI1/KNR4 family protein [Gammaproteobacteria bacterium]